VRIKVLRLMDWQRRGKKKKRKKEMLQSIKQQNYFPRRQSIRQKHQRYK